MTESTRAADIARILDRRHHKEFCRRGQHSERATARLREIEANLGGVG